MPSINPQVKPQPARPDFREDAVPDRKKRIPSLHDQVFRVPVLVGKEELITHGEAALRTDACTLGAEDALAYPDPYLFCSRNEFYCMGRADFCTEAAPDAAIDLVGDLTPEVRWSGDRRDNCGLSFPHGLQETRYRPREVLGRESVGRRLTEYLAEELGEKGKELHTPTPSSAGSAASAIRRRRPASPMTVRYIQ